MKINIPRDYRHMNEIRGKINRLVDTGFDKINYKVDESLVLMVCRVVNCSTSYADDLSSSHYTKDDC